MRLTEQQIRSLYGQDVQDRSGAKIGSVGQVWADAAGEPTWVSVKTGVMGHHESMAPLQAARMQQDGKIQVQYDKATVRSAPSVETGTDQPLGADPARLRKHVVNENVHTTVPVEHDEVSVVREPITAANRGDIRPDIGDEQREMELRAEHPVVAKEQVPIERVRLNKDEVVEEQPVNAQVRR